MTKSNAVVVNGNKCNTLVCRELDYDNALRELKTILGDNCSKFSPYELMSLTYSYRKFINTKAFGNCDVWGNVL